MGNREQGTGNREQGIGNSKSLFLVPRLCLGMPIKRLCLG